MTIPIDKEIEHRIDYEIIVDTYDGEYAICWHCYLEDKLSFPFTARDTKSSSANILTITGLLDDEECTDGMYVYQLVNDDGIRDELPIALEDLEVVTGDEATKQAVLDWCYWVARAYQLSNPDDPFEEDEDYQEDEDY